MSKKVIKVLSAILILSSIASVSGCKKQDENNVQKTEEYKRQYEEVLNQFWENKRDLNDPIILEKDNASENYAGRILEYSMKKDVIFLDFDRDGIEEMILFDEYDDIEYGNQPTEMFYPDEIKFIDIYKFNNNKVELVENYIFEERDGTNTSRPSLYDGVLLLNKDSKQTSFAIENTFKASDCYRISMLKYEQDEYKFFETASEEMAYEQPAYLNGQQVSYDEFEEYMKVFEDTYSKMYLPRKDIQKSQIISELYGNKPYSKEVEQQAAVEIAPIIIESLEASSYYTEKVNGQVLEHSPEMILDDEDSTAWVEGAEGYGVGEWIKINLSNTATVHAIDLKNGYHKSERLYNANSRIKKMKIEFSDGTSELVDLNDVYGEVNKIELSKAHNTQYVKITIVDIYEGTKYRDTCLTDVVLRSYTDNHSQVCNANPYAAFLKDKEYTKYFDKMLNDNGESIGNREYFSGMVDLIENKENELILVSVANDFGSTEIEGFVFYIKNGEVKKLHEFGTSIEHTSYHILCTESGMAEFENNVPMGSSPEGYSGLADTEPYLNHLIKVLKNNQSKEKYLCNHADRGGATEWYSYMSIDSFMGTGISNSKVFSCEGQEDYDENDNLIRKNNYSIDKKAINEKDFKAQLQTYFKSLKAVKIKWEEVK